MKQIMKILKIATLCLIVFEVILFATGWDFYSPLDNIFSMIKYVLIEAIIGLYFYRKLKEVNREVDSLYYLLIFYIVTLFASYLCGGPVFIIVFLLSPFILFFHLFIFATITISCLRKQLIGLPIRHKKLLILVSYVVCIIMGLKIVHQGTSSSKDEMTYHSDNYEVWDDPGLSATTSWGLRIYQVKGPFRKYLYYAVENDPEELKSDKAIEEFLKQKEK